MSVFTVSIFMLSAATILLTLFISNRAGAKPNGNAAVFQYIGRG
jgi:hypothetical protein